MYSANGAVNMALKKCCILLLLLLANTDEHRNLQLARQCTKDILNYVNQAVKDSENHQKLVELQRRLDMRPTQNVLAEYKVSDTSSWCFFTSLACPVIWGCRNSWLASSSILPCLWHCPLSAPPLSYLSYMYLSILGLAALFFFSPVCSHLALFSLCVLLSIFSHGRTTSVVFL